MRAPMTTGSYSDATGTGTLTDTGRGRITSRGGAMAVSRLILPLGAVVGHVLSQGVYRARLDVSTVPNLKHKRRIVQGVTPERRRWHPVLVQERFDFCCDLISQFHAATLVAVALQVKL